MRSEIKEYQAVEEAAKKFTKSVAEGNSAYAKELFTEDAVLFGFLDGVLVNDPTQFEQVDETCRLGRVVLYSKSLGMAGVS